METQTRRGRGDLLAGLCVTVLGLGYTVVALGTPPDPSTASVIGPSVVPTLLGALMTVGGVALAVTGLVGPRRQGPDHVESREEPRRQARGRRGGQRFWVLFAMLAVYVVAFIPAGYLVSTAAFLMAMTSYLTPRKLLGNVVFSVVFPVAVYLLFRYGLRVSLPPGVLGGVAG